jgi:hypothetical protein
LLLFSFILSACVGGAIAGDGQKMAITHVNLVSMTDEIILEDQTVLVEGPKITTIEPTDEIHFPEDAKIIDGTGVYLMPEIANMHMHTTPVWETEWAVSSFVLYLTNGVTTVRNLDPMPDEGGKQIKMKNPAASGAIFWLFPHKPGELCPQMAG